jgi:hypothetical protein
VDPILEYLLEFNKTNSLEYKGRYLVPPGGLAKMLDEFQGFRLNREEVIKPRTDLPVAPEQDAETESTLEELYKELE